MPWNICVFPPTKRWIFTEATDVPDGSKRADWELRPLEPKVGKRGRDWDMIGAWLTCVVNMLLFISMWFISSLDWEISQMHFLAEFRKNDMGLPSVFQKSQMLSSKGQLNIWGIVQLTLHNWKFHQLTSSCRFGCEVIPYPPGVRRGLRVFSPMFLDVLNMIFSWKHSVKILVFKLKIIEVFKDENPTLEIPWCFGCLVPNCHCPGDHEGQAVAEVNGYAKKIRS